MKSPPFLLFAQHYFTCSITHLAATIELTVFNKMLYYLFDVIESSSDVYEILSLINSCNNTIVLG